MRHLIIGDIHQKHTIAQSIIDKHIDNVDKVVLVGDYFDDFGDTVSDFINTAQWLENLLNNNKVIPLIGNHDLSYLSFHYQCSGWHPAKQVAALGYCGSIFRQLKPCYFAGNLLVTHAGLAKGISLEQQIDSLNQVIGGSRDYYPELSAHYRDGGNLNPAGIVWNRPIYNELDDNFTQIFGHTPRAAAIWYQEKHLCIDNNLKQYVLVDVDGDNDKDIKIQILETANESQTT